MPRTKGSKNRSKLTLQEQIAAAEERVVQAQAELAAAEEELKNVSALRDEEQVKALMDAIAASGRTIPEVIALIQGEEPGETPE